MADLKDAVVHKRIITNTAAMHTKHEKQSGTGSDKERDILEG